MDEFQELAMNVGVVAVPTMQYYPQQQGGTGSSSSSNNNKEPRAYINGTSFDSITSFVRAKVHEATLLG